MGCGASAQGKYHTDAQQEETLRFLAHVPLFKQLPEDQLPRLAEACERKEFRQGEAIIKQGDVGREFFIIATGEASVFIRPANGEGLGQKLEDGALKKGDYFGEKALVQDVPRTATIVASTKLATLMITRSKFRELGLNETLHFRRRKAMGGRVGQKRTIAKEPSPKTAAERQFISTALRQNENLKVMTTLDEDRVNQMIDISWKELISKGSNVISEDDVVADYFYVVQDGQFQVTMKGGSAATSQSMEGKLMAQNKSVKVRALGPGSSFGEMALLCVAPRSATVTALTESTVWVFDRDNFRNILMKNTKAQINHNVKYLEGVELLRCLHPHERHAIAEALLELHYDMGETILEQGQPGTAFYVLVEGEVVVIKDGQELNRLKARVEDKTTAYFGEMALLNDAPRTATVKVVSDIAKALVLDKDSFDILLGPLENLMKDTRRTVDKTTDKPTRLSAGKANNQKRQLISHSDLLSLGLLGCGGFGTVELCQHKESGAYYALKVMSKGHIVDTCMQESVVFEKDVLWTCDSPFIIRLYATYNTAQTIQLLLEPALGGDLYVAFQRKGFYGSKIHTVYYSAGVVCALEHLHGLKVVYRDLKPENVLLNGEGHVKVTDMGLAKVCPGKTYTVCGTPDYFAPEMLMQTGHSFALDWWTLGIFIFECLAGDPPFEASEPMEIYKNIALGIDRVCFPHPCGGSATSLIKGLLAKEPQKRFPMLKGGVKNLESHPFYESLDWDAFRTQKVPPPYKPKLKGPQDRSNFRADIRDAPPHVEYKPDGTSWDANFNMQP